MEAFREPAAREETVLKCRDSIVVRRKRNPVTYSMAEGETKVKSIVCGVCGIS